MIRRLPDFVIGDPKRPYMLRWYVIPKNRWFNVYLHCILCDDDDRAQHDHPWTFVSFMLRGAYREHTPRGSRVRLAGSVAVRQATSLHRLEVVDGPVWTLVLTGPTVREWGFMCPKGWVSWKKFVDAENPGAVGLGCDG